MCYQKNSRALAAPGGGRVPAWQLPGEREASMQGNPVESRDIPLSRSQRPADRSSDAHPGDRANASAIRVSEGSGAAEPRGLECGQILGRTPLLGRGINAASAAETPSPGSRASAGTLSSGRAESGLVNGLCGRSTGGRPKVSFVDHRGYLYSGMLGDRIRAEIEG